MTVTADGLADLQRMFQRAPQIADRAAQLAVNEAARYGRVQSSRQIAAEVNLTKGYIDERLTVRLAKGGEQAATITGRWRPTSLSRFLTRKPVRGKPVKVQVRRGGSAQTLKAFPVRLRAGKELTDSKFNMGLAIRLKAGQVPRNTSGAKLLSTDKSGAVWLLYGPSINQVFRDVRYKVDGPIADRLSSEFVRQYQRLISGG